MFELFTERARKIMSFARREAEALNSEFIGTEHLLLGILQEGAGVAAKVLSALNVDPVRLRNEVEKIIKPSAAPTNTMGVLPFTPRVKRVLELTHEEFEKAGDKAIGTEHILLGLMMEKEGIAAQALAKLDVTEALVRQKITEIKRPEAESPDAGYIRQVAARIKLAEIQQRISAPRSPTSMKVLIFRDQLSGDQVPKGYAFFNGVKVFVSDIIVVQGIPLDKHEAIAASIAKECGATGYLVEARF